MINFLLAWIKSISRFEFLHQITPIATLMIMVIVIAVIAVVIIFKILNKKN